MDKTVVDLLNKNQGVVAMVVAATTIIISVVIAYFQHHHESDKGESTPFIKAGGDVKAGRDIIVGNNIRIEKKQELIKGDYQIVSLRITDENGEPVEKLFHLKEGTTVFKCIATYADGTEEGYSPYWLCWGLASQDPTGVFGVKKRPSVGINCNPKHEKYTELSCWVFPPKQISPTGNGEIPHDSIGFKYNF